MRKPKHRQATVKSKFMPRFAWIALTNKCNLKCTHCQRELLKDQGLLKAREMTWELFKKLEEEVFPYLERIQFGGNNFGEQLGFSKWDEAFEIVSKLEIDVSLVTNGTLLDPDRIKTLIDAGVELNFSLEGASKETYEAVRGFRFNKFFDIVKRACEEKIKKPQKGAQVNLGFTIFYDNVREVTNLIFMADRIGVDRIIVTHFAPWKESQRRQSLVYHKELCNQMLEKAKNLAVDCDIRIDLPKHFRSDERQGQPEPLKRNQTTPCFHPWRSFSINEMGDVMPCCATSAVMGNLRRSSFNDIWNGPKYRKLRKTVNSSNPLVFCRNCAFREIDIESSQPISFWSDEEFLLAAIGTEKTMNSSFLVLRKVKQRLTRSGG